MTASVAGHVANGWCAQSSNGTRGRPRSVTAICADLRPQVSEGDTL
jgi:hypothetical protein